MMPDKFYAEKFDPPGKSETYCVMKSKNDEMNNQRGTAVVIALLVMALLMGFVVLALSRTTTETLATANDAAESRAFSAAEASLENMTVNFDKKFEQKLTPTTQDISDVETAPISGFPNYTFENHVTQLGDPQIVVVTGERLQGLSALRQAWEVSTTATDLRTGVTVKLRRQFFNDEVPIFQFGIFYDDDLEFHSGPRFDFGGRVHSNRNLFLKAQTGLYFSSKVSAVGQIVTDVMRNGDSWNSWGGGDKQGNIFVKSNGNYIQLKHDMGSALNGTSNGANLFAFDSDMPPVYANAGWNSYKATFGGNLLSDQPRLDLPLAIDTRQRGGQADYIELIKRGKNLGDFFKNSSGNVVAVTAADVDSPVTTKERYTNKSGIRVSLADTKQGLPGCAAATGTTRCGVQLDGMVSGAKGYIPEKMADYHQATRINGDRFDRGRQNWIKIELVSLNAATGLPVTTNVTEDFLSLGVTEPGPATVYATSSPYPADDNSRSIFKLQRFAIPGNEIKGGDQFLTNFNLGGGDKYNFVVSYDDKGNGADKMPLLDSYSGGNITAMADDDAANLRYVNLKGNWYRIVPFPIMMFDTREGLYNADLDTNKLYPNGQVPLNGVMSMLDVDVANLRSFFKGDFNKLLPTNTPYAVSKGNISLKNTDVPNKNGWVLYVSDRRGDVDFDGEYDMEDIYINSTTGDNDGTLQRGEDVNNDGILEKNYDSDGFLTLSAEAPKYSVKRPPDAAAVVNTKYYRRGVRLINGTLIPGNYDSVTPANTNGFTVASENGIYVQGNYNATGINSVGTPTQSSDYLPHDKADHIPASVVGDAITILSNNWDDASSFNSPFGLSNRKASETTVRFAILAGDTMSSFRASPNQGSADTRLGGGVHNFKRFLEDWSSVRLNYDGSLINLYNSHNNNGAYKNGGGIYSPPTRNWVFDQSFLDPNRLPPGTPFFQSIALTGFQRVNN